MPDTLTNVVNDLFSRTVSNGLGSSPEGYAYDLVGTAADFDVTGAVATITQSASASRRAFLPLIANTQDGDETTLTFKLDKVPTADGVQVYVSSRADSTYQTYYRLWALLSPTGTNINWRAHKLVSGVQTAIGANQVYSAAVLANTLYSMKLRVVGFNPATIQGKFWKASDPEPSSWTTFGTDSTAALQTNGRIGWTSFPQASVGNLPIVVSVDSFHVDRVLLATGGSVSRTPSDNLLSGSSSGGGAALPTGSGIHVAGSISTTRAVWNRGAAAGVHYKFMALGAEWDYVQATGPSQLRLTDTGGAGTGWEDACKHAHANGYVLIGRILRGKNAPAWLYNSAVTGSAALTCLPVHVTATDPNATQGAPITVPLPWNLTSAANPNSASSSGDALDHWTENLYTKMVAWLNSTDVDDNGVSFRRADVFAAFAIGQATIEGTEMWLNYGTGTIGTNNRQVWYGATSGWGMSNAPPGSSAAVREAYNRDAVRDSWLREIDIYERTIYASCGIGGSMMFGAIFGDGHVRNADIVDTFLTGGSNASRIGHWWAGETNLRPQNNGSGRIVWHDPVTDSCSTANSPPETWECFQGPGCAQLRRWINGGGEILLQTAGNSPFTAFNGTIGTDAAFQAAMTDGAQTWHARFIETTETLALTSPAWMESTLQPLQAAIAVTDGYTTSGGSFGDSVAAVKRIGGTGQTSRSLSSILVNSMADGIGTTRVTAPISVGAILVEAAVWRFELTDRYGRFIAALDHAYDRSLKFAITGAGEVKPATLEFKLPVDDFANPFCRIGRTKIKGYRNGVLRFHGHISKRRDVVDESGAVSEFVASDPLDKLHRRVLRIYQSFRVTGKPYAVLQSVWQEAIHSVTNGEIGLSLGLNLQGTLQSDKRAYEAGSTLEDVFVDLTSGSSAVEMVCRPVEGNLLADSDGQSVDYFIEEMGLLDVYQRMGALRPTAVFGLNAGPQNLQAAELVQDIETLVNVSWTLGAGLDPSIALQRFGSDGDADSQLMYGGHDVVNQFTNVKRQAKLDDLAAGFVQAEPFPELTITPGPNAPKVFDDFWLGDTVPLITKIGAVVVSQLGRIWEADIDVDNDGFEHLGVVTMAQDPQSVSTSPAPSGGTGSGSGGGAGGGTGGGSGGPPPPPPPPR